MPTNRPIGRKKNVTGVADPNSLQVRKTGFGYNPNADTIYKAMKSKKQQGGGGRDRQMKTRD